MNISEKRSDQFAIVTIIVLACLGLFLLQEAFFDEDPLEQNTITISGEGRAFAVADTATFNYTILVEAETASQAQQQVTETAAAIQAVLSDANIGETDIKTESYNVSPRYEYQTRAVQPGTEIFPGDRERVLVGYEARQTNSVRVRETSAAADLLSQVSASGADSVSNLQFVIWDETEIEVEARAEAIADAREKARQLARQLNVDLGDIVGFYEESPGFPQPFQARMMEGLGGAEDSVQPANISLGENEVRKTVSITYQIN